jgi:hypothetical protein
MPVLVWEEQISEFGMAVSVLKWSKINYIFVDGSKEFVFCQQIAQSWAIFNPSLIKLNIVINNTTVSYKY